MHFPPRSLSPLLTLALALPAAFAQPPGAPDFPGGFGPPPGRGFGPPMMQETKLVAQFDRDGDKRLDAAERNAAREYLRSQPARGFPGPRGFGGPGRSRGGRATPPEPGIRLSPADVPQFGQEPLHAPGVLRTLFLRFENTDWEAELEAFNNSDVEVPATLEVDGRTYADVGVHFRGASSFFMVSAGLKRSLNLSLDFVHGKQHLLGHRTLNLLNAHEDPSFLRSALYSRIAQDYLPAPRVNFVRVVINGENWGVYPNAEQFNKDFLQDRFGSSKGARWKVPGSPRGRGSLAYLGEDSAAYKSIYEIKSKDDEASWARLIRVCRLLEETPPESLEAALAPHFDVDGALRFLALEITFVNGDGYWTRTSDYSLGEDAQGRLHVIPHDMNETFSLGGGPGGPGGPGGGGFGPRGGPPGPRGGGPRLDPLVAADNPNAPLASRLLAVPALRSRYLGYVRELAEHWLDWKNLGPVAREFHALIAAEVKRDTRKLDSYEEFENSLESGDRSLKAFADQRRAFLLGLPAVQAARVSTR